MIRYSLVCDIGHDFEGWFRNSDDFDGQSGRGLVACPACGSTTIRKGLMAPSVATARARDARAHAQPSATGSDQAPADGPAQDGAARTRPEVPDAGPALQQTALMPRDLQARELLEALRQARARIIGNSEDVGENFAEEARRIHYGEAAERSIFGKTSPKDAEALLDEGISVFPLPDLPDDKN